MKGIFRKTLWTFFLATTLLTFAACTVNSKTKEAEPAAVSNLKAIAGDGKVTVRWNKPEASSFSGVEVFFGESKEELASVEKISDVNVSRYTKKDLTNDKTYYFRVDAFFGNDKVFESNVVSATPSEMAALDIASVDFTKDLIVGWNLGNAFDASNNGDWAYSTGLGMEYNWLPHKQPTSRKLIKAVKAAGFNTIRIPVSWHNHMSKTDANYKIDSKWMNRVKEVVDWAIAEDMYVIINIHHDNQSESDIKSNPGFCISTDASIQKESKAYIQKVWEQIADTFNDDYNEKLIFELLNEPRCVGTDMEWGFWGGNAGKAKTYCDVITAYEQVALDTIRASEGFNAYRFVMTPGYAASPDFLSSYTMPVDTVDDKLLLSVHAYTPGDFALEGEKSDYDSNKAYIENSINSVFNNLSNNYVKNGIGVVLGEASASDKKNLSSREKWTKYFFTKAVNAGVPVVLWDNEVTAADNGAGGENHGYFNRATATQYFPTIIETMMNIVGAETSGGGSGDSGNEESSAVVTLLDAENYTGSEEVVTIDGKKFIKITINGYSTEFPIPAVDCSELSSYTVECMADSIVPNVQVIIGIKDSSYKDISSGIVMNPLTTSLTTLSGRISTDSKASPTKIAELIQPMAQDTSDWSGKNGIVFYISKITGE
ncbi:MAG: cellulase family glycosylhydrolase [Treponema sp.]|nr:cellulase family glycosylhydrolase [Treponema sp.]